MIGIASPLAVRATRRTTPANASSAAAAMTHDGRFVEPPAMTGAGTGSARGSAASAAVRATPTRVGGDGCVAAFGTRTTGRRPRPGRRTRRGARVSVRAGRATRAGRAFRACRWRRGCAAARLARVGFATEGAAAPRTRSVGEGSPTSLSTAAAGAAAGAGAGATAAGGGAGAGAAASGEERCGSRLSGST
jgi:hypothetical protein